MRRRFSKLLAYVMVCVMMFTLVPASVSADTGKIEVGIQGEGGEFNVTMKGETWVTSGCGRGGGVAGNSARDMGYSSVSTPVHPEGLTFQGWAVYEDIGNGWKKVSGDTYLTTEEMLEYKLPDCSIMFQVKWVEQELEDLIGVNPGLEVSIQGNNGEFVVTMNNETWTTTGCGRGDGEAGSSAREMGYTEVSTPVHPEGLTFQGWAVYEDTGNGWKKVSGNTYLTTEEMLDYIIPDCGIMFQAKWKGQSLDDMIGGGEGLEVSIQGNNGEFTVADKDQTWITTGCGQGDVAAGSTLREIGYINIDTPVRYDGYKFKGWYPYKEKGGEWVKISGAKLLTTEQMLDYELPDYNLIFCAQWTCTHSESKTIKAVAATTKKAGLTAGKKCANCGKIITSQKKVPKISSIKVNKTKFVYNGKTLKPTITIKNAAGTTLKAGTDYKLSYKNSAGKKVTAPKTVGGYKAIVTFKGKYGGTVSKSFKINPKSATITKLTKGKTQFTVKWTKRTTQVTGYQIKYSTKANMSGSKYVLVKNNKTTTKTFKKLKPKKKYYVQIRTYKIVNGTKYYSNWSTKSAVTTK